MRVLAVLASAAVWTSAFPPRGWWPLAWIGVAPFLVAVRTAPTLLRAGVLAWLWCVAFAWCIGAWLPGGVVRYFDQPALVGVAFFLATATLTAGLHYIGFAVAYRALARRHPAAVLPLLAAAAFVAAELLRVRGPGADPWGLVGYSQAGVIALPQIADVTGVYGVTFAVLVVNAALAELWLAYRAGASIVPAARGLALAGSLVVVLAAYGAFRIANAPRDLADAGAARVAIAQGDIDMHAQWLPSDYGKNLDVYLRLTDDVLARERVALVVWPESAMTFFVDEEPDYRGAIARVTAPHGVQLLAGAPRAADPAHTAFFNSVFLLAPDGEPIGRYDKQLLLPFAEYFPLSVDLLRRRFGRVRQFTPGGPAAVLDTAAGPAGVLVCNEGFYGTLAADRVAAGATWLVSLTNDTWVASAGFSRMAMDMVRFRAIEQRRWVVRASTWGPSALIDPFGRVTVQTVPAARAAVAGAIRGSRATTPYARVGDAFGWACLAVVAIALVRRPRATRDGGV